MSWLSSRKAKEAGIHEHSSLAHAKGMTGGFIADLDEVYDEKTNTTKNSEIVSSVIEIASRVARMKLSLKVENEEVDRNKLNYLLNEKPNKFMKAYDFKYKILVDSILNGNAYVEIIRDGNNKITELRLLDYNYVVPKEVFKHENSTEIEDVVYEYYTDINDHTKKRKLRGEDVLHFKPFSFGMTVGLSLIDCLKRDMKIQDMEKTYIEEYLKRGGQVGGVIKLNTPNRIENAETKRLIAREWDRSGNNGYSVRVTDGFMEYVPSTQSQQDFTNILNNKANVSSFASLLGMPLHKLGVSTSNMSLEELNNEFKNGTLAMYIEMLETELNVKLFRNEGDFVSSFKFDLHSNVIYDTKTTLEIIKSGANSGWLTPNERRERFGLERVDSEFADKLESSLNFVDAESKNDYQMKGLGSASRSEGIPEGGGSVYEE